jgi:hypothetical protein
MAVRAATFRESSGGSKSVLINQISYLEASSFQLLPDDTVPAQGAYGSAGVDSSDACRSFKKNYEIFLKFK